MLILFLDESGDHSLEVIDSQYPIFVLGGCIMALDYHQEILTPMLNDMKKRLFGHTNVIIHTADLVRCRGEFRKMTDKSFREIMLSEINKIMSEAEYTVLATVIKKFDHLDMYGLAAKDPYMLALDTLVERFVFEIKARGGREQAVIVAESRDETLDNLLRLSWMDLRTSGTRYVSGTEIRRHISDLHFRKKKNNIAGLQLADLIVSPIGRRRLGKSPKQDWEIIRSKFRCGPDGQYKGFGLVELPRK
ncbi:MAG: DUF3800 domain-containing protein [Thermodesulfobacteriota bacterium]